MALLDEKGKNNFHNDELTAKLQKITIQIK